MDCLIDGIEWMNIITVLALLTLYIVTIYYLVYTVLLKYDYLVINNWTESNEINNENLFAESEWSKWIEWLIDFMDEVEQHHRLHKKLLVFHFGSIDWIKIYYNSK